MSTRRVVAPAERPPVLEATADSLIEQFNQRARAVRSLNAGIDLNPVAGSTYSGIIEEYHEVQGFILAQKPAQIRVIGQAPVVAKNIFDMVSDGETFRIFIPPKNRFIVGPAELERRSKKPIENLRPQHLLDALFWTELPASKLVLFEEFDELPARVGAVPRRYYIVTLLRETAGLEIARKVWFDRSDLSVARIQIYAAAGHLMADIRYADWQPVPRESGPAPPEASGQSGPAPIQSGPAQDLSRAVQREAAAGLPASQGGVRYPRQIRLFRPDDDYQLELRITKLTLNEEIAADRFRLDQPPGTELVRVSRRASEPRP